MNPTALLLTLSSLASSTLLYAAYKSVTELNQGPLFLAALVVSLIALTAVAEH
jgi:hypothetical protein